MLWLSQRQAGPDFLGACDLGLKGSGFILCLQRRAGEVVSVFCSSYSNVIVFMQQKECLDGRKTSELGGTGCLPNPGRAQVFFWGAFLLLQGDTFSGSCSFKNTTESRRSRSCACGDPNASGCACWPVSTARRACVLGGAAEPSRWARCFAIL